MAQSGICAKTTIGVLAESAPTSSLSQASCSVPSDVRLPASNPTTLTSATKRSEEHTSELQSLTNLVCRLLLEKKKNNHRQSMFISNNVHYVETQSEISIDAELSSLYGEDIGAELIIDSCIVNSTTDIHMLHIT